MPHCDTCKHLNGGDCTRYPAWEQIMFPEHHYCGEYKAGKKAAPKPKEPPNPDIKVLLDYYREEFERIHGAEPMVAYNVEAPLAKKMLEHYPLDECEAMVTEFLLRPPQFYKDKGLRAFRHVVSAVKSGQLVDRIDRQKKEAREYMVQQLSMFPDATDKERLEYEQFTRMTSEKMSFEEWRKEFV